MHTSAGPSQLDLMRNKDLHVLCQLTNFMQTPQDLTNIGGLRIHALDRLMDELVVTGIPEPMSTGPHKIKLKALKQVVTLLLTTVEIFCSIGPSTH